MERREGIDSEILKLYKQGYTQPEIAEKKYVTQGYVSKYLSKIKKQREETEVDETISNVERKVEKFWDDFISKRKMPEYFYIIVDMFIAGIPGK